jgi:hypothetical protein
MLSVPKKIAATAAALSLIISASASPVSAESWNVRNWSGFDQTAATVTVGEYGGFEPVSARQVVRNAVSSGVFESWICSEGNQPGTACDLDVPGVHFDSTMILPLCESDAQENCLEGAVFTKPDGTEVKAVFLGAAKTALQKAIPEQGLYAGGAISLFDVPGLTNGGGSTTYSVSVNARVTYDQGTKKFVTSAVDAGVNPYTVKTGAEYEAPVRRDGKGPDGKPRVEGRGSPECVWSEAGRCGIREDFAVGTKVSVSFRMSKQISGWFRGRLAKPDITIVDFSAANNRIQVTAEPVTVARMAAAVNSSNTSAEDLELVKNHGGEGAPGQLERTVKYPFSHWGDFDWVEKFRKVSKDTAAGTTSIWSFSTVDGLSNQPCLKDANRVIGVVTTNAMMYNGVVPDFKGGQLVYKVAGLHYAPDGKTLNEGTYDLVMRSDVARCLYGFSKAPISATISVVGEGGENRVATTVVSEKDGWLKLAAYGFNFSSPTISVKLSQAASPVAAKKSTITCVSTKNKKLTKKVTAVGPKCPAGYKKK